MALFVIPFRVDGKTRLGDPEIALAMFMDVRAACEQVGDVIVCDAPGGQDPRSPRHSQGSKARSRSSMPISRA